MAKRFGELSKKKKTKILGKPKYQGLTKKQVRKKYNESKGLSNRSSLSTNNSSGSKLTSAYFDNATSYAPGASTGSPFGSNTTTYAPGASTTNTRPSAAATKPSAATTTQSLLIQAGADDTDLRSGTITGSKTGTELSLIHI